MIEDKKNEIKIAENEEEAAWDGILNAAKKQQESGKRELEINKAIEKLAEEKLKLILEANNIHTQQVGLFECLVATGLSSSLPVCA